MRKILISLFLIICSWPLSAQTIGEWIFYPSYGTLTNVEYIGDEIFALGGGSLYSYNIKDESIREYTKNDGMSDAIIAFMGYDKTTNALVFVYENQNIDLLIKGRFYNISDFKEKVMTQDKTVNGLFVNDGFAYLATPFGAVVVDIARRQIADTYSIGVNTTIAFRWNNALYLGTDSNLLCCPADKNAYDKSNWTVVENIVVKEASIADNSNLYILDNNNKVYRMDNQLYRFAIQPQESYQSIRYIGNQLFQIHKDFIDVVSSDGNIGRISNLQGARQIVGSSETDYWIASEKGIQPVKKQDASWLALDEYYFPNSPNTISPYNMDIRNGKVYISSGGPYRTFDTGGGTVSVLDNGEWHNISQSDITIGRDKFNQLLDIKASSIDPETFYVSSFTGGIYEFNQYKPVQQYIDNNDELVSLFGKGAHIWVSAINTDRQGNLWAANMGSEYFYRMKTPDGKWYKYKIKGLAETNDLNPMLITQYGRSQQKWSISYYNYLTLNVLDEKGTYDDTSDDESVTYSSIIDQDNNTYSSIQFRSLVEDLDGRIWLGTSVGPFVFNNPSNIYSSNSCTRVKIPRNDGTGLADYLLDNVIVTAMAVDAANRKWIGTSGNGVYLLSADGLETIHHFTSTNSPLLSDEILSMGIDSETGLVYFGCTGGLVAYRSDAVTGRDSFSDVYAFPNPVYPDYSGVITITGLMSNTLVKITDINNNLIYQANSLGGQLSWNGLDVKGNRVKSGVYLVYGSAEDGKKGVVTKILIVN